MHIHRDGAKKLRAFRHENVKPFLVLFFRNEIDKDFMLFKIASNQNYPPPSILLLFRNFISI